jgi:hypothetical protein
VFAGMGLYYPERLLRCVVVNAPPWFAVPWRIAYSILDEVRALVCVCVFCCVVVCVFRGAGRALFGRRSVCCL